VILLDTIAQEAIGPALKLLPVQMDSPEARVMLLAIGLQESRFMFRFQKVAGQPYIKGPARSYWQCELGSPATRGGVTGVFMHDASRYWLAHLCESRGVAFRPEAIWNAIETDDVLAAGVARLLLFTDPKKLPAVDDVEGAWGLYAYRTWRPGRPRRETWDAFHTQARAQVMT
jgi:hypothetical protein